jgi:hypothetical protein
MTSNWTFAIVKRKDEKQYGEYRTKRVILEIYDEMRRAMETVAPYRTRLMPPPADAAEAHEGRMGWRSCSCGFAQKMTSAQKVRSLHKMSIGSVRMMQRVERVAVTGFSSYLSSRFLLIDCYPIP